LKALLVARTSIVDADQQDLAACGRAAPAMSSTSMRGSNSSKRLADGLRHPAGGGGAVDLENQVVNAAAEIRTHHAFTLGGAEDDPDRLANALLVLGRVEEAAVHRV
jgi:hypothetical protein